jgi:hypothetical protein
MVRTRRLRNEKEEPVGPWPLAWALTLDSTDAAHLPLGQASASVAHRAPLRGALRLS